MVQAYLKTPQSEGPIHSLVAFERLNISAGTSNEVALEIDPRSLSSVDDQGNRSILPGKYTLSVGGAQPDETQEKSEIEFTITGTSTLPK